MRASDAEGPLWTPPPARAAATNLAAFMEAVRRRHGVDIAGYDDLHRWSIERPQAFWTELWDFCGIVAEARGARVVEDFDRMPGARWFPDARLNFAENLLRYRATVRAGTGVSATEVRPSRRSLSLPPAVHDEVGAARRRLSRSAGVGEGRSRGGLGAPTSPKPSIAMLAVNEPAARCGRRARRTSASRG